MAKKKSEIDVAKEEFLRDHIRKGRAHAKLQANRVQSVGELLARGIFLQAAGQVPQSLKTAVKKMLTTKDEE